jgi:hypothetical protein
VPAKPTKGTKQTNLELPIEVVEKAREFAKSRRETLSDVVAAALLRHMANPPPLPGEIPLPPITVLANIGSRASFDGPPTPAKKGKK